jgi:hypothetical protein
MSKGADVAAKTNQAKAPFKLPATQMGAKLCRAGMPPSNGVQCNYLRGMSEGASARDCSIAQREAPDAAPGVLTDYEVEFVHDVRSAKAAGAADVGRSNGRGVVDGASAGGRGMVSNAEIGSRRGKSRSASMFGGQMRLELTGVSDGAKRETVRRPTNAEIGEGVSNLRSVKCSKGNDGRISQGVSKVRRPTMLGSPMRKPQAPGSPLRSIGAGGSCGGLPSSECWFQVCLSVIQ